MWVQRATRAAAFLRVALAALVALATMRVPGCALPAPRRPRAAGRRDELPPPSPRLTAPSTSRDRALWTVALIIPILQRGSRGSERVFFPRTHS